MNLQAYEDSITTQDIREVLNVAQIANESKRNANGSIPSNDLKAVEWYRIAYGLKVSALNNWPLFTFIDSNGNEQTHLIDAIKTEYKEFRKRESRKRQTAA